MSIIDGNPVNQTYTNERLASKQDDNTLEGKQALEHNNAESGPNILDIQKTVNDLVLILSQVGQGNTGSNVGGAIEVFKEKIANDLRFRTIQGTNSVTVSLNGDNIDIGHPIEFLSADPVTPVAPSLWYNYTDKVWRFFDGSLTTEIGSDYVGLTGDQTVAGVKTFSDDALFSSDVTVTGKVTINGDAEIGGTLVTVNATQLEVSDAFVTINKGGTDASAENAGLEIERVSDNACIIFDSTLDSKWSAGVDGDKNEIQVVVKGTEAAVLATASPNTSTRYYATDTGKHYLYDAFKSEFLEIGSGSGGGNGSPDIYALYDAEDEDLTDFTGVSINAVSPLDGDFSYTVLSYPATFPVVTINERSKNKLNALEFHYKLASGTAKAVVKDDLGAVLTEQEISSTSVEKVALQFYVKDATVSVQLEIQDVTSSTALLIDDVFFTDSAFVPVNLEQENTFSARIENNGTATVLSSNVDFIESVTRTSLGSVDVTFKTGFFSETPSVTATTSDGIVTGTTAYISSLTSTGVTVRISRDGVSDHDRDFNIDVHSQGADYRKGTENLVFSNTGTENTFSARIQNNGTATILSESTPFIQSATRSSLGFVDIVFTPGFFTVAPSVTTSAESNFDNTMISTPPTVSGVTVKCIREDGAADIDKDFALIVQRQGADYKNPNAYAVVSSITDQLVYSETETDTGKTWSDGKKIYRKLLNGSYANNATLLTGVDKLIDCGGIWVVDGTRHIAFPHTTTSFAELNPSTGIVKHSSTGTYTLDIWIEYTKD